MVNLKVNYDEYIPLRDIVFKTLREAIITGDLKPGERLMEIKLANELGVSRTPVREAIRKLELEGLVIMTARKGAEVAPINEKDLRDALLSGRVQAAAMDVLSTEPAKMDNPLMGLDNCIITPHIAWAKKSMQKRKKLSKMKQ